MKKELLKKCKSLGIPLVGFAPVERWKAPPEELPNILSPWIPEDFWPQSIYPEARTVIVIGLPVALPIVETAPSIYYHELYKTVNAMLDTKACEIANFLNEKGYGSIYLPRVRFTSIFTTAEIPPDPIRIKDLCIKCLRCVKSCPVSAIPLKGDFPPPVDKKLCAIRSAELRDEYRSPCGICIKVCPVGKDRELYDRRNMSIYSGDAKFERYHKAWEHVRKYGSK